MTVIKSGLNQRTGSEDTVILSWRPFRNNVHFGISQTLVVLELKKLGVEYNLI